MFKTFHHVDAAIKHAKSKAEATTLPQQVWRNGESFGVIAEGTQATPWTNGTLRPVATYDPDGTEHC
jgi:hypothetical protein